jgi:hypothetical protein
MSVRHLLNSFHAFISGECVRHCSKAIHEDAAWHSFTQSEDTDWRPLHAVLRFCLGDDDAAAPPKHSLAAAWFLINDTIVDACRYASGVLENSGVPGDVTSSFQRRFWRFCCRIVALKACHGPAEDVASELFDGMRTCSNLDQDDWLAVMPLVVLLARSDSSMTEQATQVLVEIRGHCIAAHASTAFNTALQYVQRYFELSGLVEAYHMDQLLVESGRMSSDSERCLYYRLATEYGSSPLMATLTIRGDWVKADRLYRAALKWAESGSALASVACYIYINNLQACLCSACTPSVRYSALDPDWADTACSAIVNHEQVELRDNKLSARSTFDHLPYPDECTWTFALHSLPKLLQILRSTAGMDQVTQRLSRIAAFICLEANFLTPNNLWRFPGFSSAVWTLCLSITEESVYTETAARAMKEPCSTLQAASNTTFLARVSLLPPTASKKLLYCCVLDSAASLYNTLLHLQDDIRGDGWGGACLPKSPAHLQLFATCRTAFLVDQPLSNTPVMKRIVDAVENLWQRSEAPVSMGNLLSRFPILEFFASRSAFLLNAASLYPVWQEGAAVSCHAYGLECSPVEVKLSENLQHRICRIMSVASNVIAVVIQLMKEICSTPEEFRAIISAIDGSNTALSRLRLVEQSAFAPGLLCCLQALGSLVYFCHCLDTYWRVMSLATPTRLAPVAVEVPPAFASVIGDCENFVRTMLATQQPHDNCISMGSLTYMWKVDLQRLATLTAPYSTDSTRREHFSLLHTVSDEQSSTSESLRQMCLEQSFINTTATWLSSLSIPCQAEILMPSANDAYLEWLQCWKQFVEHMWLLPSDVAPIVQERDEGATSLHTTDHPSRVYTKQITVSRSPLADGHAFVSSLETPALLLAGPLLASQTALLEESLEPLPLEEERVECFPSAIVSTELSNQLSTMKLQTQSLHHSHIPCCANTVCEYSIVDAPTTSTELALATAAESAANVDSPSPLAAVAPVSRMPPMAVLGTDLDQNFEAVFARLRDRERRRNDYEGRVQPVAAPIESTMDADQPRFAGLQTHQLEGLQSSKTQYMLSNRQANLAKHIDELESQANIVERQMEESTNAVQSLAVIALQRATSSHMQALRNRAESLLAETTADTLLAFM